ncbi:pyridoxamine 5'-phosphate oxidase family protein [Longispora urticae]
MDYLELVHLVNTDPVIQTLNEAPIPMRLGYVGLDGHPRTVPVAHIWDGSAFVFASPTTAYKVRAIRAHPQVSFTIDVAPGSAGNEARAKVAAALGPQVAQFVPIIMLVRGTATVEIQQGLPQAHVDGSRRMIVDKAMCDEWERIKRETTTEMAVISIVPTHVTVCDFITRFPPPHEVNVVSHGAEQDEVSGVRNP